MGPSGSGKSTLLYLVGGLDKPTKGKVLINDKDISKLSDNEMSKLRRRDIGFVFQFYNLVQNLTVEENIMLPVVMNGEKESNYKERLDRIVVCGMSDNLKDTYVFNLGRRIKADLDYNEFNRIVKYYDNGELAYRYRSIFNV